MTNNTGTYYYLAVGDTLSSNLPASGDYLDLTDTGSGPSGYLLQGFQFTPAKDMDPLATPTGSATGAAANWAKIVLTLRVFGTSADNMQANIRAIDLKLRQARLAWGAQPQGTGVCLWQREQNMTQFIFWDVCHGEVGHAVGLGAALVRTIPVTLYVMPYAHGVPVTTTATGTITNGTASVLYVAGITGDVPALGQLTLTDVSTNTPVINGWSVGARSQPTGSMLTTDYTPILALTPASPGAAHVDATAIGGTAARVTASGSWQTVGTAPQPAGAKQTGLMDVFPRLKDASVIPGKPGTPTATGAGSGGNLRDGIYQYLLTTYDGSGNESPVTASAFATVPVTTPASNYVLLNAENGDTGGWDGEVMSGIANGAQGAVDVTTAASLATVGSVYGYAATAANGGGDFLYKALPGGGNTIAIRTLMKILTDTPSTGYVQIPLVASNATPPAPILSLFNIGAGWKLGFSGGSFITGAGFPLPDNSRVRFELVAVWNGSNTYTCTVYINDVQAAAGTVGVVSAPTNGAIGALSNSASSALAVSFDDVQIANARIGSAGGNAGSAAVSWTAGTNQSGYFLYFNRNGGSWYRIDVGNVTSYSHTAASAGTLKDPPSSTPAITATSFKVRAAANTSTATPVYVEGPVAQAAIAGGSWEEVYAGAINLPPLGTQDDGTPRPWILQVQVLNAGTSFTTFDADSIRIRPHKELPQFRARVSTLDLATKRQWVTGTNRYGISYCELQARPTVIDTFTRATNLSALGTSDTGQTYTVSGGTFGISNNRFYVNTVTTNDRCYATLTGTANGIITATLVTAAVNEGYVIFRYVDNSNMYMLFASTAGYRIYQWAAGVRTSIGFNAQAAVTGDQIAITLSGTSCSVAVNGLPLLSGISVPNNSSAALIGLGGNGAATEQWDDFKMGGLTPVVEGSVTPESVLLLGPGDTKLDLQPVVAGGKSDVVDCKFTAQLTYTPRFRYQRGNT